MTMNDTGIHRRLAFNRIDVEAINVLRSERQFLLGVMPAILDKFYSHVGEYSETSKFFKSREHMMHAKEMQLKHWSIILDGKFDDAYEVSVKKIGETPYRGKRAGTAIGIAPLAGL